MTPSRSAAPRRSQPTTDAGDRAGRVRRRRRAAPRARSRRPEVADNEVLVRVHAAGLDRGTWHLMTGKPYLMRIAGLGFRGPKDRVPGRDLAGTVEAVGSAVTRFAVGDEVYGVGRGSFAEYAVAREDKLARKPATPVVRTGRRRPDLGRHRTPGADGPWPGRGRPAGAGHRRVRGSRQLRRTAGEGARGRGHRAWPAPRSWTWSAPSAPTTSSTTPETTTPTAPATTT